MGDDSKKWDEAEEPEDSEESQRPPDFADPRSPNPVQAEEPLQAPTLYQPDELDEHGNVKVAEEDQFRGDRTGTAEDEARQRGEESADKEDE